MKMYYHNNIFYENHYCVPYGPGKMHNIPSEEVCKKTSY